jgi:hypothetical protein
MGHAVDALDIDPRSGGDETKAGLMAAGMWPRAYGVAGTPSGGSHHLIAPLGERSLDALRPGLDVKTGRNGDGHGFIFIAPTIRRTRSLAYSATTSGRPRQTLTGSPRVTILARRSPT